MWGAAEAEEDIAGQAVDPGLAGGGGVAAYGLDSYVDRPG